MYLVKWKNYPMDQCTWEPYRNLTNCQDILSEYKTNKIVPKDIYASEKYKKLFETLDTHTEQELIESMQNDEGMPSISEKFVQGTIAYLTTISLNARSESLMKLLKHNLKLFEVNKRRQKQLERLDRWEKTISDKCGFHITVSNIVDFEGPPKKFVYSDDCIPGNGVKIPNDPPLWYVK